jgi:hypothetical protein
MAKNHSFERRIASISPELWSKIAAIDEWKGRWIAGANLSPQALGRLKQLKPSMRISSLGWTFFYPFFFIRPRWHSNYYLKRT